MDARVVVVSLTMLGPFVRSSCLLTNVVRADVLGL